jgi:4-amino-4-deoxy-L-arabinose transferase-like glycosyltransferase
MQQFGRAATTFVLVLGLALCAAQVDRRSGLIDMDEVAWIANGRFLDVFLAGDVDNPDWWAFDRYAHHPPIGNYLVGTVLHAIGEPMTSMEPRRFWYEHDVDAFFDAAALRRELNARVTDRQLLAVRVTAAVLTWLTLVGATLVTRRLAGWWAACATSTLLLLHPTFMVLGQLGQLDALMTCASVVAYAAALGLAQSTSTRAAAGWSVALTLSLVVAFGLKISGAFLLLPTAVIVVLCAVHRRRALLGCVAAVCAAGLFTIALDPALYHHPVEQTLARLDWRLDRVSIQQLIFVERRLASLDVRLAWSSWQLLLGSPAAIVMSTLLLLAAVHSRTREQWALFAVAVVTLVMAMGSVALAWPRYVAVALPAAAIAAGVAITHVPVIWQRSRRSLGTHVGIALLFVVAARVALSSSHEPPAPTPTDLRIKAMMVHALHRPGADLTLHTQLLQHFERIGDERRARVERDILNAQAP